MAKSQTYEQLSQALREAALQGEPGAEELSDEAANLANLLRLQEQNPRSEADPIVTAAREMFDRRLEASQLVGKIPTGLPN